MMLSAIPFRPALLALLLASPVLALASRVELLTVAMQPQIHELQLTGSVVADRHATLSSEVAGLVRQLHAGIGDTVSQGQLLVSLDDDLARIARDSAGALALRASEQLADSQRRLQEAQALALRQTVSVSEVRSLEAEVRINQASLAAANATLAAREAELARHHIRAPFAGTISRKLTDIGQWLSPGGAVLELVDTTHLWIDVPVPQRYFSRIDSRSRLQASSDDSPPFAARVVHKIPVGDNSSRSFLLRSQPAADAPPLIAGMSVSMVVQVASDTPGIRLPADAIQRHVDGRASVWLVSERDGSQARVIQQPVQTGQRHGDGIDIVAGLKAGQQVVIRGHGNLRHGQTVSIGQPLPAQGQH